MNKEMFDLAAWSIETAKSAGADDCRVGINSRRFVNISYRERKPENIKEASTRGLSIEVFANIGKSGGDTAALAEAIGRLISIALQKGVGVEEVSQTLIGITGSRPVWNEGNLIKSVPDGIGQILLNEFGKSISAGKKGQSITVHIPHYQKEDGPQILSGPECPECGNQMELEGGCSVCRSCGYSHCG